MRPPDRRRRRAHTFAAGMAVVLLAVAGCAPRAIVLPTGPRMPAPDGDAAWRAVAQRCRDARSIRTELHMSGRIAGRRVPGLTVGSAVDAAGSFGFAAYSSGRTIFRLGGGRETATLLLDDRVVTAPAGEIVDALVGVRLDAARWLAVLAGCATRVPDATKIERMQGLLVVETTDGTVYLQPAGAGWAPRAATFEGVAVEYPGVSAAGWPARIRIGSAAGRSPAVALDFEVRALEINPSLPPAVFQVDVPPGASPMSLQELRASGPLRGEAGR